MNKAELVSEMAKLSGLKKSDTEKALEAFVSAVQTSLKNKEEVRLVGFGTFGVSERKATEGRNPRTGEKINIPASTLPKFKAGKVLKDFVN